MTERRDVPEWLILAVNDCRRLVGVGDEWHITITVTDAPAGRRDMDGAADVDPVYMNARLEFAPTLKNDQDGYQVILHEVLHIALAPLYQAAGHGFNRLANDAAAALNQVYNDQEEAVIQKISRALMHTVRPVGMETP